MNRTAGRRHRTVPCPRTNTQLADYNPLRYRGYVYDFETGLYYLQSRYYNPEWGRFINGDGLVATGQGLLGNNMFAYCGNNPVIRNDPNGYCYGHPNDPHLDWSSSGVRVGVMCGLYGIHGRRPKDYRNVTWEVSIALKNALENVDDYGLNSNDIIETAKRIKPLFDYFLSFFRIMVLGVSNMKMDGKKR